MFDVFKRNQVKTVEPRGSWRAFCPAGVAIADEKVALPASAIQPELLDGPEVDGLLVQMDDDGRLATVGRARLLPWSDVYELLGDKASRQTRAILKLPNEASDIPALQSDRSLRDADFSIRLGDWRDARTQRTLAFDIVGAAIVDGASVRLMPRKTWELIDQVARFDVRPDGERTESENRRAWGRIRRAAIAADARLDDFLFQTVVLTPEKLQVGLRKDQTSGTKVVEIVPTFEGAPDRWLEAFDTRTSVPDRYNLPTPEGIVSVEIAPNVRTVLENIKRLPGRRVAGTRAEAFLVNPFAALGEAASATIDEAQFMRAREVADLLFERFFARVDRDPFGYPAAVALRIEIPRADGSVDTEVRPFVNDDELQGFVEAVEKSIARKLQLCGWEGYDFEIMGETEAELAALREALAARAKPQVLVSYASIYDLAAYAERIEGIGEEKPFYSPYIAKKSDDDGWFPDNILPVISFTPDGEKEPVAVPITPELKKSMEGKIAEAEAKGLDAIDVPGLSKPMPLTEAKAILKTIGEVEKDVKAGTFDPAKPKATPEPGPETAPEVEPAKKPHLVIRANIQAVDYNETRRDILAGGDQSLNLPDGILKPGVGLKEHQVEGVGWLQHRLRNAPAYCRGVVLADDMGLGKTLQLLTLIATAFRSDPGMKPVLVVAPVSLLENWEQEAKKFLVDGNLRLLVAYGDALAAHRVARENVDEQLRKEGLVRFLTPNWRGDANVVLTTYETLRDLEFSFGAEKWSIMICDEAQRIKNPNAMTTKAAKKMNVAFRVACTGTPVENTLTDLWCLFDYVQPGLLGALNDFGARYRRPIEAETDEEKARVEELRRLIAPQILRRVKKDVAKDLPAKLAPPVHLKLSNYQRNLYAAAIEKFKKRETENSPFKNHLGLLHYLRQVCTDPREYGLGAFRPEPLETAREKSPKLGWLIDKLREIKDRGAGDPKVGEKVIVFCEFRDMQRMLRHYIGAVFGFAPDIINGDTSASSKRSDSRQKRIDTFQTKAGFGVIILSPVAVGFGVNIQAANHVVHFTRHWNPAKEDQATDRAYRIGQEREVSVYCPIVTADDFSTFDVKLDKMLTIKRGLAEDMLNGSPDVGPSEFDIVDMVPPGQRAGFSPKITVDDLARMEARYFEGFVAALWQKRGYRQAYVTPPQDGGVDVVALKGRSGDLIQCKSSSTDDAKLGWDGVKDVAGGYGLYAKRHPDVVFAKVCVTNQFFNATAHQMARHNEVALVEKPALEKLLERHEVTKLEVEKLLVTNWGGS